MSKTLLLADDSVVIQKLVGLSFANEDVTLVTTDNGDDAIARASEARPDLVLADVVMPGKNGYEVCEAIKQTPELSHVPVLLLTGTFEAFDEERARAVGSDGHITKPFEAQVLVDRVNELLSAPQLAGDDLGQSQPGAGAGDSQSFDFFERDPARELVSAEPSAAAVIGAAAGHDQTIAIIPDEPAAPATAGFEPLSSAMADTARASVQRPTPPSLETASVFDEPAPSAATTSPAPFTSREPTPSEPPPTAGIDVGAPHMSAQGATTAPAGLDVAAGARGQAPPALELDDRSSPGDRPALDLAADGVADAPHSPPPLDLEPLAGAEPASALTPGASGAASASGSFDLGGNTPTAVDTPPMIDFDPAPAPAPAADTPPALDLGSSLPDASPALDLGPMSEASMPALDLDGPQLDSAAASSLELGQADPRASLDLGTASGSRQAPPVAETLLADAMMGANALTPPTSPEAVAAPDATTAPAAITTPDPLVAPDPFAAADPAATVLADELLAAPVAARVEAKLTPPAATLDDGLGDRHGVEADTNGTLLAEDLFEVQPELSSSPEPVHDAAGDSQTSPRMQPVASAMAETDLLESDPLADPALGESRPSAPPLAAPGSSFEDALTDESLNQPTAPGDFVPEVGVSPELAARAPSVPDLTPMLRDRLHETLEKVAWEAFADLSDTIVRQVVERVEQIAWEAIPQMAEALIQEEIRRMKGEEE